jgi:hypothetical protein
MPFEGNYCPVPVKFIRRSSGKKNRNEDKKDE